MIDIDLHDIRMIQAKELNYLEIDRVKKVELENKHLTYLLIGIAVVIGIVIIIEFNQIERENDKDL